MSLTTTVRPPSAGSTAPELERRLTVLTDALRVAGDQVDPEVAARARADLEGVRARFALGADHTVVALVGGTGSGKSSLFNAISGLVFADVGTLRPTTDEAAACVWGTEATALLDFLQVAPVRRIQRESELDGDHERDLHGMVLLDLPDHDSITGDHAEHVDRLLPLVDLLVWVVDPQKYADNLLHERYLQELRNRQENLLVVVNQADTLPAGAVERVRAHVRELLAADGLDDVAVLATSAVQHTGIGAVREHLAGAVARPATRLVTAHAEVDAVAAGLEAHVARAEPGLPDVGRAAAELARAAGPGVADAVVSAVRTRWVTEATAGLPARWADGVDAGVASAAELLAATGDAVAASAAAQPQSGGRRASRFLVLAAALGLASVAYVVLALVQGLGAAATVVPALAGMVAAAAVAARAVAVRREDAAVATATLERRRVAAAGDVVDRLLTGPTAAVLDRHRRLREAVRAR
jgi:GTP-binding protein EngB required for normal cell division